jgi:predicted  nucleic acid-binding Zn-ribbon protein
MKAKQQLINELNAAIEEVKRTVATKEEELLLKGQHLDEMNKQIEELQSHLRLGEQKYKDEQSKNTGSTSYINYDGIYETVALE